MKLPKYQSTYFIGAVEKLLEKKVDLHFSRTKTVDDCSGFFMENPLSLKVAIWRKDWFSIFLHEYQHFLQWTKQTDAWKAAEGTDFLNSFNPKERLVTQLIEQEADVMAHFVIKTYNLEGMENHIREANAYHASYVNMEHNKSWFKSKKSPYQFDEILDLCPNDRFFTKKELDNPDPKLFEAINRNCF